MKPNPYALLSTYYTYTFLLIPNTTLKGDRTFAELFLGETIGARPLPATFIRESHHYISESLTWDQAFQGTVGPIKRRLYPLPIQDTT